MPLPVGSSTVNVITRYREENCLWFRLLFLSRSLSSFRRQKNDDGPRCLLHDGPTLETRGCRREPTGTGNGRSLQTADLEPVHLTNRTSNANKQPPIARPISFVEAKPAASHLAPRDPPDRTPFRISLLLLRFFFFFSLSFFFLPPSLLSNHDSL